MSIKVKIYVDTANHKNQSMLIQFQQYPENKRHMDAKTIITTIVIYYI